MNLNETSKRGTSRRAGVLATSLLLGIVGCSSPDDVTSDASSNAMPDSASDVSPTDVAQPDATQPDATQPDATQTDATQTDATQSDLPVVDAPAVDATVFDAPSTDATRIDVTSTDVTSTDATTADVPRVDVGVVDAPRPDVATVDVPRTDAGAVDVVTPPDTGCAGAFTVRVTAPTAMQSIETCTVSGMPVFFTFTAEPSSAATSVEFAWRTPEGTLAPPAWPAITAAPFAARRQVGGMMVDVPPLAVLSRRTNWTVEVTARDRCGRTAMTTQPFTLIYTNRGCPNP